MQKKAQELQPGDRIIIYKKPVTVIDARQAPLTYPYKRHEVCITYETATNTGVVFLKEDSLVETL